MNKNIVIFGCDNSGKTTLSQDISKELDLLLRNNGLAYPIECKHSLGPNVTLEQHENFMNENLDKDCITIFDRFPFIEEGVCGSILRGHNIFGHYTKEEQDVLLSKVDLFILCYPGLFNIINWGEREQMEGVKENVVNLIKGYNMIAVNLKDNGYNVVEYNYRCDAPFTIISDVAKEVCK